MALVGFLIKNKIKSSPYMFSKCIHILTLSFVACIVLSCNQTNADRLQSKPPEFPVLVLAPSDVTLGTQYVCEVKAVQFVAVHARVQGYLEEIFVDEGSHVKKGQPMFRISDNEYREMVTKAEANVQRMIAEAKTKKLQVERIRLMVDKKVISSTELEVATAQLEAAESGVNEANSILQNAKINLGYTFIRAPFDGVVDLIPFKRGSLINSGTQLTSMSNAGDVFAYFKLSEAEYIKLAGGELKNNRFSKQRRKVELLLADGTRYNHPGVIETMEGGFDPATGSIAVRARFSNPQQLLKHGSSGKIIMNKTMPDALLIPQASAFSIQDKNYVFVVDDQNIAHARNFTTVARTDKHFVTTGLRDGERIVLEGALQLKDGMKVTPKVVRADSAGITSL
jgi:membrane fusion protein (multidrug efflux system)